MGICEQCGRVPPLEQPQTAQEVEAEIFSVEALMEQLEQRRLQLKRKANTLLPISHLPADILLDIFAYACKQDPEHLSAKFVTSQAYTPLFLGSVCAYWRNLLWNTPLAWRDIAMSLTCEHSSGRMQLLVDWLERAQETPLHITLAAPCDSIDDVAFVNNASAVLEVLATRSQNWECVDLLVPIRCFAILLRNHFPSLTSFRLRPPPGSIAAFNPPPDIFINNTPSIAHIDLVGYDYSSMVLPWSQLRSFKGQFLSAFQCLDVLRESPNLIELHVDKVFVQDHPRTSQSPSEDSRKVTQQVHANLQVLDLGVIRGGALQSLFNDLSLPTLRELSLTFTGSGYWQSLAPLKDLAQASSSPSRSWDLRKLRVSQNPLDEGELAGCLEVASNIVELDIEVAGVPTERLDDLHAMRNQLGGLSHRLVNTLDPSNRDGGVPSLPQLQFFGYRGPILCPLMDVVGMLFSRSKGEGNIVPLTEAAVVANQSFARAETLSEDDERRIRALEAAGIWVSQQRNSRFW